MIVRKYLNTVNLFRTRDSIDIDLYYDNINIILYYIILQIYSVMSAELAEQVKAGVVYTNRKVVKFYKLNHTFQSKELFKKTTVDPLYEFKIKLKQIKAYE